MSKRSGGNLTRPGPWRSGGAALLLALALAGQGAGYLHLLIVPHGVCAAHGDLTDLASPAVAPSPASDGLASFAAPRAQESEAHHCFATAGRRESPRDAITAPGAPEATAQGQIATTPRAPWRSTSILRFAPKHSPPLV